MSIELFRQFVEDRPDEEHWELIDGVASMMPPPTLPHQQIAMNLLFLLHAALQKHSPKLKPIQRPGINIGPAVQDYDPEPDVVVIDADATRKPGKRYAERFYLAAEIVSESDRTRADNKRDIYKLHENCTCVLTIQQDRVEVRTDLHVKGEWTETLLTSVDDWLILPEFGLRCRVAELYRETALQPPE